MKSCTKEHLPNFYSRCKDKVESSNAARNEVLQCYVDSIKDLDTNGEVKQGVKELEGVEGMAISACSTTCFVTFCLSVEIGDVLVFLIDFLFVFLVYFGAKSGSLSGSSCSA